MNVTFKKISVALYCCIFTVFGFLHYVEAYIGTTIFKDTDIHEEMIGVKSMVGYYAADVSDDIYYIQNNNSNKYIDIHGPSTASGALIHEWTYHPNKSENWRITKSTDGYYIIKSLYSNKYIGVDSSNIGVGKDNIKQYYFITDYTKWVMYFDGDDNYVFKPKKWANQYLSSPVNSSNDELQLSSNIGSSIEWKLHKQENISNGTYFIQNFETRKYADLCGPSTADGAVIHQWDLNASNLSSISSWRKWEITKQTDLYYTIKNVYSGKYMGVESSTLAIKQYTSVSDNTKWKIYLIDSDTDLESTEYIFVPKGYSYAPYSYSIGVEDGSNSNGRDLEVKGINESRTSWKLSDASMTYLDRINTWQYEDTRFDYFIGYFEPQGVENGTGYIDMQIYAEHDPESDDTIWDGWFNTAINHATDQWTSAMPDYIRDFENVSTLSSADIEIYGGDIDYFGYSTVPFYGATSLDGYSVEGFVIYLNEILRVFEYDRTIFKILSTDDRRSLEDLKITITHEMGHALGYAGHSYSTVFAVVNQTHDCYVLQTNEILHLKQIWEIFYE